MKRFEIFKAGKRVDSTGRKHDITVGDLRASCEAYDPSLHQAPLVIGHPKTDDPAWGWVGGCFMEGEVMTASASQVVPEFAEAVQSGRYKQRSASFYLPDHPANPTPGVYHLRHVGFLGAQPPSVKGLKAVEFGEEEEGVVFFEEAIETGFGLQGLARMIRGLKNLVIELVGLEKANEILPEWEIDSARRAGEEIVDKALSDTAEPAFSEEAKGEGKDKTDGEPKGEAEFSEEEKRQMDDLEKKEAALKKEREELDRKKADFAEKVAQSARQEAAEFVEGLVKEGKLKPCFKDGLVELLVAGGEEAACFAEEGKDVGSSADFLMRFLTDQPKIVDFEEKGGGGADPDNLEGTAAEKGRKLGEMAAEFVEEQKAQGKTITIIEAMDEVSKRFEKGA